MEMRKAKEAAEKVAIPSNQVGNFHRQAIERAEKEREKAVAIPSNQVGNFHQRVCVLRQKTMDLSQSLQIRSVISI